MYFQHFFMIHSDDSCSWSLIHHISMKYIDNSKSYVCYIKILLCYIANDLLCIALSIHDQYWSFLSFLHWEVESDLSVSKYSKLVLLYRSTLIFQLWDVQKSFQDLFPFFSFVYRFMWVYCNIVTMFDENGTYYSF